MAYDIKDIEGVGAAYGEKLGKAGITNTDHLLDKAATPKGRKDVAEASGLSEGHVLKLANMADLMRVKGVGGEFAELLNAAGVDTIKELRTRNAANLAAKMGEVNAEKKLTRVSPSDDVIQKWIDDATNLEGKLTY